MSDKPLLTPERLTQLLTKLNEVMAEAERLRREVTRQLGEQRQSLQQKVSGRSGRRRAAKRR